MDMLEDVHRTGSYFDAITRNRDSFKDKVVLDVGAGTCILSIFAAKAGAKQVFAVEATDMAVRSRKIVEAQGLSHIIHVVQGTIETATLPCMVDVIISEWMGYFLLRESMLDSVLVARDRFLKPGGALFPSHATLFLAPVGPFKACREKQQTFDGERQHFEDFNGSMVQWYSTDFSCMREEFLAEQRMYYLQTGMFVNLSPKQLAGTASPVLEMDLLKITVEDLKAARPLSCTMRVSKDGHLDGFAGYFDVAFRGSPQNPVKQEVVLTTAPTTSTHTHWGQQWDWRQPTPLQLRQSCPRQQQDVFRGRGSWPANDLCQTCKHSLFGFFPALQVNRGDSLECKLVINRQKKNHRLLQLDACFSVVGLFPIDMAPLQVAFLPIHAGAPSQNSASAMELDESVAAECKLFLLRSMDGWHAGELRGICLYRPRPLWAMPASERKMCDRIRGSFGCSSSFEACAAQANRKDSSAAIQALGSAGWWQEALALFEVALRLNSRGAGTGGTTPPMVDVRMYNAAIAALRSSPFRWQQAFALVHAMSVSQLQPDIATVNSAATALKGELLWKQTLSAYAAATKQGVCMDKVGTNILMAAMVAVDCRWSLGMESLRFALLQQLQPDVCSLGCVLGILSSQSHWARSCWQLRAAAAAALDMDTIVLNSALSSTEEVSHWAAGLSLLTTTLRHELRTDAISFNAVLAAASKQGVWWHGLQYLEWLHQLGEPTLVSYNSLLVYADGDGRRWETAVQILDDMTADCCSGKAREFLPDVVTVSSVGNMLQAFAQWEQAMLLANPPHEGSDGATLPTATSAPVLGNVMAAAERAGCWERALDLIRWAQARAAVSDMVSCGSAACTAVMGALSKGKKWRCSLGLAAPLHGLVFPTSEAVNAVISSFSRGSCWPNAISVVEQMYWSRLQVDVFTCTSAISSCEKALWLLSLELLWWMQRNLGLESMQPAVNAAVSACGSSRSWKWPLELMFGSGSATTGFPDASSHEACQPGVAAVFLALSEAGRWEDALKVSKQIHLRKVQPDVASYGLLVMQCEQEGMAGQEIGMLRALFRVASGALCKPRILEPERGVEEEIKPQR
ncbi:PRMT10 [Symbiodinium microadriaticum]|nr:PRMT10 [Symbiodinium microadriaticum]